MNAKHAAALRIVAWAALPICLATMQVQAAPPTAGQTASSRTTTTTATPRKLTIAKLGDFESGEMVSEKDDVGWAAYKFAQGSTLPQSTARDGSRAHCTYVTDGSPGTISPMMFPPRADFT